MQKLAACTLPNAFVSGFTPAVSCSGHDVLASHERLARTP
jgi:hypothetical protein